MRISMPTIAIASMAILSLNTLFNTKHRRYSTQQAQDVNQSIRGKAPSLTATAAIALKNESSEQEIINVVSDFDAIKEVYISLGVPKDLMSSESHCDWAGIKCASTSSTGKNSVVSINLLDVELHGTISPRIGDLPHLKEIIITGMNFQSHGDIHGSIPRGIGKLTELETLNMSGNKLSGSLPNEIGSLSSLTYLSLGDNSITGPIPRDIGKLHKLVWLGLDSNKLSGAVPQEMEYLTELGNVGFFDNEQLSGTPSFLCNVSIFDYGKTAIPENLCDLMTPFDVIG